MEIPWKNTFVCFLILVNYAKNVLSAIEMQEDIPKDTPQTHEVTWNTNSTTYELCGETTKCICVDTVVRKTIQCDGGRLYGQLPSKIVVPQDYTAIDFSRDSIPFIRSDTFDGTYVSLSVVQLDFSNNDIEYIEDGTFEMFQALRELIIRRNRLANLTLGVFRNLRHLETLDLSYNNIATVDMDVLYPCISLRRLSMRFNPLSLQGLQDLLYSASNNLEDLDLHGLNLERLTEDLFRPVSYVERLIISGNRFDEVPGEALSQMRRLTVLDLSDNFIDHIKDIDFQGLENLEELQLNRMRNLQKIGENSFATLRNLKIFSCSFNARLKTIHPKAFPVVLMSTPKMDIDDDADRMPPMDGQSYSKRKWHLEEIHLRQNGLTTLSEKLLPWKSIRYVDLSENPWNCDCRLKWIKKINWDMKRIPSIRCEMPRSVRRRLIGEITSSDMRCESPLESHITISIVLLVTTASLLAIAMCLVAFHKCTWFSVCRATFQRRYSKLKPNRNGQVTDGNKTNNNCVVHVNSDDDVEMNIAISETVLR